MSSPEEEFGAPLERVVQKIRSELDEWLCRFIACSPFALMSTASAAGDHTISPRGGEPGFIRVVDSRTLLVPDYAGNKLFESARNLAEEGPIAMLLMIPGFEETARVSGRGWLRSLAQVQSDYGASYEKLKDPRAQRYFRISVARAYYHCGKAPRAAGLWDTARIEAWRASPQLPKRPPIP